MIVSGALIVPFIINYLIIIPFIPVSIVFLYIRNYFVKSGQQIKRLENIGIKFFFLTGFNIKRVGQYFI